MAPPVDYVGGQALFEFRPLATYPGTAPACQHFKRRQFGRKNPRYYVRCVKDLMDIIDLDVNERPSPLKGLERPPLDPSADEGPDYEFWIVEERARCGGCPCFTAKDALVYLVPKGDVPGKAEDPLPATDGIASGLGDASDW